MSERPAAEYWPPPPAAAEGLIARGAGQAGGAVAQAAGWPGVVGPAVLISAALFAAVHISLSTMIPFAATGVIWGLVYLRTNSLTASTMAHAGWNAIVTVIAVGQYGIA